MRSNVTAAAANETTSPRPAEGSTAQAASGDTAQRMSVERSEAIDAVGADVNSNSKPAGTPADSSGSAVRRTESRHPARKGKSIPDASATLKNVNGLLEQARQAKSRQDHGQAFRLATQAWEATQRHPDDARLRSLAQEVSSELDAIGSLANSKFGDTASYPSTKLIDK